jgi:cytochrome c
MRLVGMIPVMAVALALGACGDKAPDAPVAEAPAVPAPALSDLPAPYNEADLAKGKDLFGRKCGACHFVDRKRGNMVGPNLNGVFDHGTAELANYDYSPALKNFSEPAWTPDLIDQWLQSPDNFVPGTSMRLNGITDPVERRDLIAHLLIASRQ